VRTHTVLGVDPGSRHVGLGILRGAQILHQEELRLDRDLTIACSSLRLRLVHLVREYRVDVVAFESMQFRGHATANTMAVLALTGVIRSLADQVPVQACRVTEWRTSLLGELPESGLDSEAWKAIVRGAVARACAVHEDALPPDPGGHMGDALGIALHAMRQTVGDAADEEDTHAHADH